MKTCVVIVVAILAALVAPIACAFADDPAPSAQELHRLRHEALKLAADATRVSNVSFIAEEWPPDGLETTIVSLDQGLVKVKAGIDDGLYPGHRLSVERKGHKIATLLIIKADYDSARARIITRPQPTLSVGDMVLGIGKPRTVNKPQRPASPGQPGG